jgi:hypothetical protein
MLHLERLGGVAGFGTTRARIRSHGQCDLATLSSTEIERIEQLFQSPGEPHSGGVDAFRLRLTRSTTAGAQSVVVPESAVPSRLLSCIRDELL